MIYPASIEHKLGFDTVRGQISALCISRYGRDVCDAMAFMPLFDDVAAALEATAEMVAVIGSDDGFPLGEIHDMDAVLASMRLEGASLSPADFLRLRSSLIAMSSLVKFFTSCRRDDAPVYPRLDALSHSLAAFPALVEAIDRVIDRWGNVRDNASPALSAVRQAMAALSGSVNAVMRRVIARVAKDGIVEPDVTPSVRDGRLVIPVSPMHKRKIQGIVHDESASGKTVFIEPAEVVETNNRIRTLQLDERREIVRILTALTDVVRPHAGDIMDCLGVMGVFDFIHAKARYAAGIKGSMPKLSSACACNWKDAFHPVLQQSLARQGKEIVPMSMSLDADHRIMVISGPNAGGKSVALKTVGLLQYMTQCGVLPTLAPDSTVGVYDSVFVDIGDDQSLEDDLSTYSSHLRNMKTILTRGDSRSLILIDEFGAGTEPQIGGAIAQALLSRFNDKGLWGIITTHFQNLKLFAEDTPGLVNGSMLYDRHLMQPLFRLSVGSPGSSFAVEIARKTGLPADVIAEAETIVGSDYINADKYLLDINRDKRYWENKRADIKQREKRLRETIERYEADAEELRRSRRDILDEARREARRIIDESNAAVERTIRDIRVAQADRQATLEARAALTDRKNTLADPDAPLVPDNNLLAKAGRVATRKGRKRSVAATPASRPIAVGDKVTLEGASTVGIVSDIKGDNATVIFGQLTTNTKLSRLTLTDRKVASLSTAASPVVVETPPTQATPVKSRPRAASFISVATREEMRRRQLAFSQNIDLRGMRVDEALQAVTYYIDDAVQFDCSRVRILHGTGTGALRQAVREYLATVPAVRSFHDEDVRLGGAGITVVDF